MHFIEFIVTGINTSDPAVVELLMGEVTSFVACPGGVSLTIESRVEDPIDAVRLAAQWLRRAVPGVEITALQCDLPQRPLELLDIAAVARLLGVTQSRAKALAALDDAPIPLARLRSGPIWSSAQWEGFEQR